MIEIVSVRLFAIHPVNQGFTLIIDLEAEGQIAVPVPLHLCREPRLDSEDCGLHRIDHLGAEGTVLRSEVDQSHGAGLAHVQVRQRLGDRLEPVAFPAVEVDGGGGVGGREER